MFDDLQWGVPEGPPLEVAEVLAPESPLEVVVGPVMDEAAKNNGGWFWEWVGGCKLGEIRFLPRGGRWQLVGQIRRLLGRRGEHWRGS